ncbi:hypothetical protein [Sulfurimonas sp.]
MLITPEIITLTIINIIFFFFASLAFYFSVRILLFYDPNATTQRQYKLEKQSYLIATVIKFIFYIKIPLFIFFIFTLNKIATILPGAMCGAGVVNATEYGTPLLMLKILNLYIFGYWIVLNGEDMNSQESKYLRLKFLLFCFAYILLVIEIVTQIVMFFSIDVKSVVNCCGAIFSTTNGTYLSTVLGLKVRYLLSAFYGIYLFSLISYLFKNRYLFSLLNILFLIISLISLIAFFGTYIYELPTHHCPFCLLQKDYNYIGYFLYIFLFIGTFYGLLVGLIDFSKKELEQRYRISLLFNFLYLLVVSYFPIAYYLKNGVFL